MAEFENLQRASSESEVNSSVLDRYFALASTYPAVAFPKIESLAQKHLRKLRRDKPKPAYAIDGRLEELHNLLQPTDAGAFRPSSASKARDSLPRLLPPEGPVSRPGAGSQASQRCR
jgi:hypothetical protein